MTERIPPDPFPERTMAERGVQELVADYIAEHFLACPLCGVHVAMGQQWSAHAAWHEDLKRQIRLGF